MQAKVQPGVFLGSSIAILSKYRSLVGEVDCRSFTLGRNRYASERGPQYIETETPDAGNRRNGGAVDKFVLE